MFCPLCKAEYREGFEVCHDCHISLVSTAAKASELRSKLWKGDRQKELDRILGVLDSQGIPCHYKEIVNSNYRATILGFPIGPRRSTFEYEVWVLRSNKVRAEEAIRKRPQ